MAHPHITCPKCMEEREAARTAPRGVVYETLTEELDMLIDCLCVSAQDTLTQLHRRGYEVRRKP